MAVEYDEIYIAAMKEIDVCEKAIRNLSKTVEDMERRYGISSEEFMERFGGCGLINNKDYMEWHDSFMGLNSWKAKLKEFQKMLKGQYA